MRHGTWCSATLSPVPLHIFRVCCCTPGVVMATLGLIAAATEEKKREKERQCLIGVWCGHESQEGCSWLTFLGSSLAQAGSGSRI